MVLLSDAILTVRDRCDVRNDPHISDSEITGYLNVGFSKAYGLMTESFENYNVKTLVFTLSTSDDGYAVPEDWFKTFRFDRSFSGDPNDARGWITLSLINPRDENLYNRSIARTPYYDNRPAAYLELGNRIKPLPQQLNAALYRLLYYPAWQDLSDLTSPVLIGPKGQHWEELGVIDACIKVNQKNESDYQGFMLQLQGEQQRLKDEAATRNAGQLEPPPLKSTGWAEPFGGDGWGWDY